jgi:hypothetical protein
MNIRVAPTRRFTDGADRWFRTNTRIAGGRCGDMFSQNSSPLAKQHVSFSSMSNTPVGKQNGRLFGDDMSLSPIVGSESDLGRYIWIGLHLRSCSRFPECFTPSDAIL